MVGAFGTGLVVGLSVAIFVGYAAMAVLETAARDGLGSGLSAGLGIATADTLWAAVAAAGTVVNRLFMPWSGHLNWAAVAVLAGLVVFAVRKLVSDAAGVSVIWAPSPAPRVYGAYLAATAREPVTVVYFLTLTLGVLPHYRAIEWAVFVAGVFLASMAWQAVMAAIGARRGRVLSPRTRRRVYVLDIVLLSVFMVFVAATALGVGP